jgi:hypothetical protein
MGPLAEQATVYVAATYDSAQICVYLDDLAPACVPSTKSVKAHGASLLVGFVGTSGGFEGVIDELAIYTHALTPQRIREHYLAGNGP